MDKIFINQLSVDALIGIYQHELATSQKIIIDLELQIDAEQAAREDDISKTLDYDLVINKIRQCCEHDRFKLIETLAENIAHNLLTNFATNWVKLTLTKPEANTATREIGITIERSI